MEEGEEEMLENEGEKEEEKTIPINIYFKRYAMARWMGLAE